MHCSIWMRIGIGIGIGLMQCSITDQCSVGLMQCSMWMRIGIGMWIVADAV